MTPVQTVGSKSGTVVQVNRTAVVLRDGQETSSGCFQIQNLALSLTERKPQTGKQTFREHRPSRYVQQGSVESKSKSKSKKCLDRTTINQHTLRESTKSTRVFTRQNHEVITVAVRVGRINKPVVNITR